MKIVLSILFILFAGAGWGLLTYINNEKLADTNISINCGLIEIAKRLSNFYTDSQSYPLADEWAEVITDQTNKVECGFIWDQKVEELGIRGIYNYIRIANNKVILKSAVYGKRQLSLVNGNWQEVKERDYKL